MIHLAVMNKKVSDPEKCSLPHAKVTHSSMGQCQSQFRTVFIGGSRKR